MLKPIETLEQFCKARDMVTPEIIRKTRLLRDALLSPFSSASDEEVLDVFAHGSEAVRIVRVKENEHFKAHIARQVWNANTDGWVREKVYDKFGIKNGTESDFIQAVIEDVKKQYSPMPASDVLKKWSGVLLSNKGAVEQTLSSKERLAGFYYDSKVTDWSLLPEGNPWIFMDSVAQAGMSKIVAEGIFHSNDKRDEKILSCLSNLSEDWRTYGPINDLVDRIRAGHVADDMPILMEHFGCDFQKSFDAIVEGRADDAIALLNDVVDLPSVKASGLFNSDEDYADFEIFIANNDESEWRYVVSLDRDTGAISTANPQFSKNQDEKFEETGARPPEKVCIALLMEMESVVKNLNACNSDVSNWKI